MDVDTHLSDGEVSANAFVKNEAVNEELTDAITKAASVGKDTRRVQSALCTRMRLVLSWIRLDLKTSV